MNQHRVDLTQYVCVYRTEEPLVLPCSFLLLLTLTIAIPPTNLFNTLRSPLHPSLLPLAKCVSGPTSKSPSSQPFQSMIIMHGQGLHGSSSPLFSFRWWIWRAGIRNLKRMKTRIVVTNPFGAWGLPARRNQLFIDQIEWRLATPHNYKESPPANRSTKHHENAFASCSSLSS